MSPGPKPTDSTIAFGNDSGDSMSHDAWLTVHHKAKHALRIAYVKQEIVRLKPNRIADLGCGTGHWLSILNQCLPSECELIGVDYDQVALSKAVERAKSWDRKTTFQRCDLSRDYAEIPGADLYTIFNIFPYLGQSFDLLDHISSRPGASAAIRQWDGDTFRFGPMSKGDRRQIENSLHEAFDNMEGFKHYYLDPVLEAIHCSSFRTKRIRFETYQQCPDQDESSRAFFDSSIKWYLDVIDDDSKRKLFEWRQALGENFERHKPYFFQTDLTAILR